MLFCRSEVWCLFLRFISFFLWKIQLILIEIYGLFWCFSGASWYKELVLSERELLLKRNLKSYMISGYLLWQNCYVWSMSSYLNTLLLPVVTLWNTSGGERAISICKLCSCRKHNIKKLEVSLLLVIDRSFPPLLLVKD